MPEKVLAQLRLQEVADPEGVPAVPGDQVEIFFSRRGVRCAGHDGCEAEEEKQRAGEASMRTHRDLLGGGRTVR